MEIELIVDMYGNVSQCPEMDDKRFNIEWCIITAGGVFSIVVAIATIVVGG